MDAPITVKVEKLKIYLVSLKNITIFAKENLLTLLI